MTGPASNPAVVPEPPTTREKQYRVVGTLPVLDHQPGDTFKQTIDPKLEAFLLEVGHIEVVAPRAPRPTTPQPPKED